MSILMNLVLRAALIRTGDPRVHLEQVQPAMAAELLRVIDANRDHLKPWLPGVDGVRSVFDTRRLIGPGTPRTSGERVTYAIIHDGQIVGTVSHHDVDWVDGHVATGYWISRDVEGRGVAKKAVGASIDYSFEHLGYERIEIAVNAANVRSARLAARLGFEYTGTTLELRFPDPKDR